jgi:hypothetical protein
MGRGGGQGSSRGGVEGRAEVPAAWADSRPPDRAANASAPTVGTKCRPSSPLCPLAVHLALSIRDAVTRVPGVTEQEIKAVGYVGAEELNALLEEET